MTPATSTASSPTSCDVLSFADDLPSMVWVKNPDGSEFLNRSAVAFLGVTLDEVIGGRWIDLVHPDDAALVRLDWGDAMRTGSPYEGEWRIRNASGEYRWIESRGEPVLRSDGAVQSWVGSWTDIDERRRVGIELTTMHDQAQWTLSILESLQNNAPVGITFFDRDCRVVRMNDRAAMVNGSSAEEQIGHTIAELTPELWPLAEPFYRSIMETGDPVLNVEVTGPSAEDPIRHHTWLSSAYPVRVGEEIVGIGLIIVDITDQREQERLLLDGTRAAVDAIAAAVEARDIYTAGHQRRVADLAVAFAEEMGVDPGAIEGIRLAATIHDIGKVAIPAEILNKPGALTTNETALVQEHSQAGYDIVRGIRFPWPVADMILQHHERMDGSGYPSGLAGADILLGARIIAVADTIDAMASHRPYRPSKGLTEAMHEVTRQRGTTLDADVVDACLRLFQSGRLGTDARLVAAPAQTGC